MKKIFLLLLSFSACSYPEIVRDELVYENDFETESLNNIYGGGISTFNNSKVIGDFNNDGFSVHIDGVGDHDYVFVSFDLYIHGSWDGNKNGFENNDKPDKWILEFKPDMDLHKDPDYDKFVTTFSNSPCWPNYCLTQSFPGEYPTMNNPKNGYYSVNLESKCPNNFFGGPTTLYKIEKGFRSSGNSVVLRFYDELYQPNAIDKDGIPQMKCDESWSLDNLAVRVVQYN